MSELTERLKSLPGLKLESTHIGLVEAGINGEKYLQDKYSITISYNDKSVTSEYSEGIGNRKLIPGVKKERGGYYNRFTGGLKNEKDALKANWLKLVPVTLVNVLYCLLSDGRAGEGTFEDFCGDFGYDTDSRSALAIYLACQKTRNDMLRILGMELFNELSALEH